jgi:hypothetical protein
MRARPRDRPSWVRKAVCEIDGAPVLCDGGLVFRRNEELRRHVHRRPAPRFSYLQGRTVGTFRHRRAARCVITCAATVPPSEEGRAGEATFARRASRRCFGAVKVKRRFRRRRAQVWAAAPTAGSCAQGWHPGGARFVAGRTRQRVALVVPARPIEAEGAGGAPKAQIKFLHHQAHGQTKRRRPHHFFALRPFV